jgi:hypothetical protein
MTAPFQPADGKQARWRYCYELAAARKVGEQITVQEVMELLDCDERTAWASMRDARDQLEADGKRSVRTVPQFGWVVADASTQIRMASDRSRRAGRQVKKAIRIIDATPRDELSQFERQAADRQLASLTAMRGLHARKVRIPLSEMAQQELAPASGE